MRKVAILLLCIFNFIFLYSAEYSFEQISVKDGLSNATVVGIIQDKNGFLWFATRNGLNRYNGKNFKEIKTISSPEIEKSNGIMKIDLQKQQAKYLKIVIENLGIIPDGQAGAGNKAWLFIDEISVE